jgi:hypothetical protein
LSVLSTDILPSFYGHLTIFELSYHNLLSKTARALAAYVLDAEIPGADNDHVWPVKSSLTKPLDEGVVILDCLRWTADDGNPGRYLVEVRIVVKTPVSNVPQIAPAIGAPGNPIPVAPPDAPQAQRLNSEQFVSAVFDLFFTYLVQQDFTVLADNITAAGRALAAQDPTNNGDLALFKCDEITFSGGSGDANQDGDFWEDVLNLTLYVRAVADTE